MRKLSKMTEDANRMTSPSQDSNVWQDIWLSLSAGLKARYPDPADVTFRLNLFWRTLEDGLNGQSVRAMKLGASIQEAQNSLNKKGGGL